MTLPIRLLVLNNQVKFSTTLKKTLEQTGGFEVAVFTSHETALEFARNRSLNAVMIDFRLRDGSAAEFLNKIRLIQPDIAVIVSPSSPEIQQAARGLGIHAAIDLPISARNLIPILQEAVTTALDSMPDTVIGENQRETVRGTGETREIPPPPAAAARPAPPPLPIAPPPPKTRPVPIPAPPAVEQARAQAESNDLLKELYKPAPSLEEGGTVRDLAVSLNDGGTKIIDIVRPDAEELALESSQPVPTDSPLPNIAAELLKGSTGALKAAAEKAAELEQASVAESDEEALSHSSLMKPVREIPGPEQLAVQLMQAALNLTADATLLTDQKGEVIAAAGKLPPEDIEDFKAIINEDWGAGDKQSRIRFVNLPSSGKDYMLFSRRTLDIYTLTMIFSGKTSLTDIRRQSEMVVEALLAEPEPIAAPVKPAAFTGTRAPHTFIWLLHPDHKPITNELAHKLVEAINVRLTNEAWVVHALDVYGNYVYLFADVPGETSAGEIIARLKELSGQFIRAHEPTSANGDLWLDAYLILVPGRAMNSEEIRRFVNFAQGYA